MIWTRLAGKRLRSADFEVRRRALRRWAVSALVLQGLVLLLAVGYVVPFAVQHARGFAWAAPAIGLLVGCAVPLQLAVIGISRAGR